MLVASMNSSYKFGAGSKEFDIPTV